MIVLGLGKYKDPRVVEILIHLLKDDDVVVQAASALGKLRATKAKQHLKRLSQHPFAHVEAGKALNRIEKAKERPGAKRKTASG